ncbi:hypothetical protein CVU37_00225 [candidate division BRC1 bacterium HGW-BRC1-1]|jgi:hypothetical protein|nr:MAG: hypothetical protein CVU37_00225 [candidate division BRC1 bacterium HGW-BRC1-1]
MFSSHFGSRTLASAFAIIMAAGLAGAQPEYAKVKAYSKSPNANKVGISLFEMRKQLKSPGADLSSIPAARGVARTADAKAVKVEVIFTTLNATVLQKITRPGVTVEDSYPEYRRATLAVTDLSVLEAIAGVPEVAMVRALETPITSQGTVDSRAPRALNVGPVFGDGLSGLGQTVGILSDSFAWTSGVRDANTAPAQGLAGTLTGSLPQDSENLPYQVQIVRDDLNGSDEGAAMAELVHDVAPGAKIAFHTAAGGEAGFAAGIKRLRNEAKASVIVDDIIYFAEPMYQDGIVAREAAAAVAAGVPYFSAAGNFGDHGLRANYRDCNPQNSPTVDPPTGNDFHDWGGGNGYLPIYMPEGTTLSVVMQWNQPFASLNPLVGSQVDLDLYLFSSPNPSAPLTFSKNGQGTTNFPMGDAYESMNYIAGTTQTVFLAVNHHVGNKTNIPQNRRVPLEFRLVFTNEDAIEYQSVPTPGNTFNSSTMWGHCLANGAVSVAAVPWWEAPAFIPGGPPTGNIDPESFTSRGGVHSIQFDVSGRASRYARSAFGPTLSAVDGNNTSFFGVSSADANTTFGQPSIDGEPDIYPNFFGTSAAAPNAAAVAALMKQKKTRLRTSEITSYLTQTAIDVTGQRAAPGTDDVSGAGLINAEAAVARVAPGGSNLTVSNVIISTVENTAINNTPYLINNPGFADVQIANIGDRTASSRYPFTVEVFLDGFLLRSETLSSLPAGGRFDITDLPLGILPVGYHTLRVVVDPSNSIYEANETDNEYSRVFRVVAPGANLRVPDVVISTQPGTSTDDTPYIFGESAYADVRILNAGDEAAMGVVPFNVNVAVDGNLVRSEPITSLPPNGSYTIYDIPMGVLPVGDHTLTVAVDTADVVFESNESDNGYSRVFRVDPAPVPPNDLKANPLAFPACPSSSLLGSNVSATVEPGDGGPIDSITPQSTVWYSFVAPISARMALTATSSDFDPMLRAFDSANVVVSENNDAWGMGNGAQVEFDAAAGSTYRVMVASTDAAQGNFVLNWYTPRYDQFGYSRTISGMSGQVDFDNHCATLEVGESLMTSAAGKTLWYTLWPAQQGSMFIDTKNSSFPTVIGVYNYPAAGLGSIAPGKIAESSSGEVVVTGTPGTPLMVCIDAADPVGGPGVLHWGVIGLQNDDLAFAQEASFCVGETTGITTYATKQPNEPTHGGLGVGKSVWYKWTAASNTIVTFDTAGSSFDTVLAVYTDLTVTPNPSDPPPPSPPAPPPFANLSLIAANNNIDGTVTTASQITFYASSGRDYYVAVDGKVGAVHTSGEVFLTWGADLPQLNDFQIDAVQVGGALNDTSPTVQTLPAQSNLGATRSDGEQIHAGIYGRKSVWYKYIVPANDDPHVLVVEAFNAPDALEVPCPDLTFDIVLGIYRADGTPYAFTDEDVTVDARFRVVVFPGQTYFIAVDGKRVDQTGREAILFPATIPGRPGVNWDAGYFDLRLTRIPGN